MCRFQQMKYGIIIESQMADYGGYSIKPLKLVQRPCYIFCMTLPFYIPVRIESGSVVRLVQTPDGGAATEEWNGRAWVSSKAWASDVMAGTPLTPAERAALSLRG